ncbi:hypothetical protein GO988_13350 [Hymenobacter sp. HMF4947]|uniref:Secreted protein n=1 Tax=Hymenobacter ginkgonis TaxID=2682976 RepID=A0A7K1TFZ0_9BACT|nr:hypothetical protein [Hymenobacter ginkgonis]MVN77315.1 hypothetical protein [Hymenobacter ginkgonis]
MLRATFLFLCLLGLAASVADATPAAAQRKPYALRNSRLTRGNFVPVYKTYRNHSHQDRPLFSFLHFGGQHSATARHRGGRPASHSSRRHTTGIF